jgi:hypothetical protein
LTTIVTRAGKGSPLTNNEVDANFVNLNDAKIETLTSTDTSVTITGTGSSRDLSVNLGAVGDVDGPASAVANDFASFDGVTGKLIKDSGYSADSFATAAQGTKADAAVSNLTSVDGSVILSPTGTVFDLSVGTAANTGTLIAQVRNETGATLTKGTIVYPAGAAGNKMLVQKALATSDATSAQTYGMIQADIPNNQNGFVVITGEVAGLNTLGLIEGGIVYLSPTVAGGYTQTKPSAPNHLVYVGIVTRVHANQGVIQTRIQNGYELDELHDVAISGATQNDFLVRNGSNLWVNQNPATARTSMGLGTAAVANSTDFDPAGTAVALAIALG